jgi:hypothetical protein
MRGAITLAVGLGVGYLVGTKRGRQDYEKIKRQAARVVNDPRVQRGVDDAQKFVSENVPVVGEQVASVIGKANDKLTDASKPSAAGAS